MSKSELLRIYGIFKYNVELLGKIIHELPDDGGEIKKERGIIQIINEIKVKAFDKSDYKTVEFMDGLIESLDKYKKLTPNQHKAVTNTANRYRVEI